MASRDPEKVAEEERIHFQNTITAFKQYAPYAVRPTPRCSQPPNSTNRKQLAGNNRRRKDIFALPLEDQAVIDKLDYKRKLVEVDNAILANAAFLDQIVANPEIFENDPGEDEGEFEESLDEPPRDGLEGLPANR
jgi:carnosine N-methyltransferase